MPTRPKTIALLSHFVAKDKDDVYYSHEHAVVDNQTDEIVQYMKKVFMKHKYHVQIIHVSPDDLSELKKMKADFIFNLVDSKAMEVQIAKLLKRVSVPYSGSSAEAIMTSNNKLRSKKILEAHTIPIPKYHLIRPTDRISKSLVPCTYPVIIKPAYEHCSLGITTHSVATNYRQFVSIVQRLRKEFHQTLLAEEFIEGKEFHVTVLETKDQTFALPIAEIEFRKGTGNKWKMYGYDEKWSKDLDEYQNCRFVAPPKGISEGEQLQIKHDAIKAFYALGFRDYARFDVRYNTKKHAWYFLEGNANAGFDPAPRDAMTASILAHGMTMDSFMLQIVKNSLE